MSIAADSNAQSFCSAGLWMNGTITNIGKQCNQINYNDLANLPPLSGVSQINPALITATDWGIFNGKQAALGFTPENSANKGAVSGYAPLNASSVVPLANLPTIPFSQLSGVDASGAASTAQTNAQTFAANASNISSGTIAAARVATLNQNTTGNSATSTAFAATPGQCGASNAATGVTAAGTANCSTIPGIMGFTPANVTAIPQSFTGTTNSSGIITFTLSGFTSAPKCVYSVRTGTATPLNAYQGTEVNAPTTTAASLYVTAPVNIIPLFLGPTVAGVGAGVAGTASCQQ